METTTRFGLYWPSSGCLGNLRASYTHARARGVEISTYAYLEKPNQNRSQTKDCEAEQVQIVIMYFVLLSVSVLLHSVLFDSCFDSVCQDMRV